MLKESLEEVLEEELEPSSFASLSESSFLVDVRSLILILWFLIVPWLGLVWVLTDPELTPLNLKLTLLLFCTYLKGMSQYVLIFTCDVQHLQDWEALLLFPEKFLCLLFLPSRHQCSLQLYQSAH